MRLRSALIVAFYASLSAPVDVRADLHPESVPAPARDPFALTGEDFNRSECAAPADLLGHAAGSGLRSGNWSGRLLAMPVTPALHLDSEVAKTPQSVVRELPPSPGSAGLFLSGILSLGAWQLVRSSRHFHIATLPEWYHPGGPHQIGHTAAFDLGFSALPLFGVQAPDQGLDREPSRRCAWREAASPRDPQCAWAFAAPRAPPVLP